MVRKEITKSLAKICFNPSKREDRIGCFYPTSAASVIASYLYENLRKEFRIVRVKAELKYSFFLTVRIIFEKAEYLKFLSNKVPLNNTDFENVKILRKKLRKILLALRKDIKKEYEKA